MQYFIEQEDILAGAGTPEGPAALKVQWWRPAKESDGDTIIFLHDSLGCISLWRDFPAKLAGSMQATAMAYDRRGYGASASFGGKRRTKGYLEEEAEVLIEVLERCGIAQPVLFGHSDGGSIALIAAAKYPGRIKAVITEGAHVFVEDITLDGIALAVRQYGTTALPQKLERYHGAKTEEVFRAWTDTWLDTGFRDWNIAGFLPRITCPVLVIQGVEDEYGSSEQVNAIADGVSGPAEICMVVNAGHTPHRQNEWWLVNRCCAFLRQYFTGQTQTAGHGGKPIDNQDHL